MMRSKRFEFRKAGAGLLALMLTAAMLAVSGSTVVAITDSPDEPSNLTACLGAALSNRGFTDVPPTHTFHESINCLAHYGITIGSGDGSTFSPDEPVKRWQMMLFLTRALGPAGVNLNPARDQQYTDVDHLGEEAIAAINLMATNGIAIPIPLSNRVFEPDSIVDRTEMAQLLVRFLDAAGSVVSFDREGNILLDADADGIQSRPDDYFKDASDQVPRAADKAISAAYELGITTGVGPTPASGTAQPGLDFFYRPRDSVTRGQMAAFIIRTLGHTLARPVGLSAQWDGTEIRVSLRDEDFEPVVDAPIDMFYIEEEDIEFAFTSRRVCDEVESTDGSQVCEIDDSDLTTDDEGEVSLTVPQPIIDGIDTALWIWTGRYRDEVSSGTPLFEMQIEPSTQTQGAIKAELSTSFRGSKARFDTTVTFTVQLMDAQGNNVQFGTDGKRPAEWNLREELISEATGSVDGDNSDEASPGSALRSRTNRTLTSDSNGRVRFSLSVADPDRGSVGQSRTRTFRLTSLPNAPNVAAVEEFRIKENSDRADGSVFYLEFSDATPVLANSVVSVTSNNQYVIMPSSGSARNSAVVSVFDEYGRPLSDAKVSLTTTVDNADTTLDGQGPFVLGGDGVHRFSYTYSGAGGVVETLTPVVDPDGDSDPSNNLAALEHSKKAHVFWANEIDDPTGKHWILFADLGRNRIIVDTEMRNDEAWPGSKTVPEYITYRSNDRFDFWSPDESRARPLSGGISEFEEELAKAVANPPDGDLGVGYCLEWKNYGSRDVATVTLIEDLRTCTN